MDSEKREVTALVEKPQDNVPPATEAAPGYWLRTSRRYSTMLAILCFVLAVFLVVFSVLSAHAFSYDSLFYFGKDISTLISLADLGENVIYYDYEGALASPVAYRGGIAVAYEGGVDVYAADGELLLAAKVDRTYLSPRIAVSRDYLVTYDFGGTAFCVCNSYAKLYEGTTDHPILGVAVSNAGYFSLITASDPTPAEDEPFYLSEVLLYDADFNLVQHFGRASATVSAAVSDNGRTIALVGAVAEGTLVDVYMIGDKMPLSTTTLTGFPLVAGYTASSKLAVLTDNACHTLTTEGKLYDSFSYDGAALSAYSVSQNGIAIALETDRLHAAYRVVALDKKGNVELDVTRSGGVVSLALSDDYVWLLGSESATCLHLGDGETVATEASVDGALAIAALDAKTARILFPAQALDLQVSR